MYIQPLNSGTGVPFGLNVKIDKKILKSATQQEIDKIKGIKRDLVNIKNDANVQFNAVQDSHGRIVNVSHTEDGGKLPSLYEKDQSFRMDDFIGFLEENRQWYEIRFFGDRDVHDAFG